MTEFRGPSDYDPSLPSTTRFLQGRQSFNLADVIPGAAAREIEGDIDGGVHLGITSDGLLAAQAYFRTHVEVSGYTHNVDIQTRVLLTRDGRVVEPAEPEPIPPSILDFRQPFDNTYELPPIDEQLEAGRVLGIVGQELFDTLPPATISDMFPGYRATEACTSDLRIIATRVDETEFQVPPGGPTVNVMKHVMGAPQGISVFEQKLDGSGQQTFYLRDKLGVARRMDAPSMLDSVRDGLISGLRLRIAGAHGREAFARVAREIQYDTRLHTDPLLAAEQGVNYLPVHTDEIHSLVQTIGQTLGITERLEELIAQPPGSPSLGD
ncbi:MAG TPA: hypothetical protein VJP80_05155 [Candidatus Saccharimonadales bacterium]|nr:hypothetical protein [Candidatus Saccharimonadales bacterium]